MIWRPEKDGVIIRLLRIAFINAKRKKQSEHRDRFLGYKWNRWVWCELIFSTELHIRNVYKSATFDRSIADCSICNEIYVIFFNAQLLSQNVSSIYC